MSYKKECNRGDRGFTLIELLVVISIIATLSTVVMASLSGAKTKAEDAKKMVEVRSVGTAIELYKSNRDEAPGNFKTANGHYATVDPATLEVAPAMEGSDAYNASMQKLVDDKILAAIPKSPDGQSYSYFNSGEPNGSGAAFLATLTSGNTYGVATPSVTMNADQYYYFRLPAVNMNLESLNLRQASGWVADIRPSRSDLLVYMGPYGNDYAGYTLFYYKDAGFGLYDGWYDPSYHPASIVSTDFMMIKKRDKSMTWQLPAGTVYYGSSSDAGTQWANDFKAKYNF
jgi:general secretion pathway protein G